MSELLIKIFVFFQETVFSFRLPMILVSTLASIVLVPLSFTLFKVGIDLALLHQRPLASNLPPMSHWYLWLSPPIGILLLFELIQVWRFSLGTAPSLTSPRLWPFFWKTMRLLSFCATMVLVISVVYSGTQPIWAGALLTYGCLDVWRIISDFKYARRASNPRPED